MARRRKTYVPRRKPKGLGKVIRRGTTRGRPRNFGQSAKRETSASRQLDNGKFFENNCFLSINFINFGNYLVE